MAKDNLEDRIRAALLYTQGSRAAKEISSVMNVSMRTIRRWVRRYRMDGVKGLVFHRPGPEKGRDSIPDKLNERIIRLKHKHPSWGARRIEYQYDLPCHWITVHRVIKSNGMLVRIRPKPQQSKRFQRRHVDSMWQGYTFQFRIAGTGRVYVTGFTDDRSRFRVVSKAYLHKSSAEAVDALRHALKKERIPRQIYLDNGKQFTSKEFRAELAGKQSNRGEKRRYQQGHCSISLYLKKEF